MKKINKKKFPSLPKIEQGTFATTNVSKEPIKFYGDFELDIDEYPPLVSSEEEETLKQFYDNNVIDTLKFIKNITDFPYNFDPNDDNWIQTYSGRRFTPLNPNSDAIVIQDIAHSLAMQCRFTGHSLKFYSVAQHSVLVSYICDYKDRLWGLLHDSPEAYLIDIPRPLKHSGQFENYKAIEKINQNAICKKFNLELEEPASVKRADSILLATEMRDLMYPRTDWKSLCEPLPFKIIPWTPEEAEQQFLKRFFELSNYPNAYDMYAKSINS